MDGRTGRSSAEYRNYAPEEPSSEPGASSLAENGIASDIGGENSLFVRHRVSFCVNCLQLIMVGTTENIIVLLTIQHTCA